MAMFQQFLSEIDDDFTEVDSGSISIAPDLGRELRVFQPLGAGL